MLDRLVLKSEMLEMVGLNYATVWKMMKRGEFPRSRVIGGGSAPKVAWKLSEINEWIDSRPLQTFSGDPGRADTAADEARRAAGRKGGLKTQRRKRLMAKPRTRLRK